MAGDVSRMRRIVSLLVAATFVTTGASFLAAPAGAATTLPLTLHFRSEFAGIGNADWLLDTSVLSTEPSPWESPNPPAVWHSPTLLGANGPKHAVDAYWTWTPTGGYSLTDVSGEVFVYAGGTRDLLFARTGWVLEVWQDNAKVFATPENTIYEAVEIGIESSLYKIPVGPFTASGTALTLKLNPVIASVNGAPDAVNYILYDHVDYPSRIELTGSSGPDTVPPTAPTGLTARNVTAASVDLNWTAATDNVGVDHYVVYRTDADPDDPYDDATFAAIGTATGKTYTDTGLLPLTTYSYKVGAVDAAANAGPLSASVTIATLAPDTTPPVISGLRALVGSTVARVNWTTDEPATGLLEYGTTLAYGSSVATARGRGHVAALDGLALGTTYHYRIAASDAAANVATLTGTFTTEAEPVYWLHRTSLGATPNTVIKHWMDELNTTGDADGGYNPFGAAMATLDDVTGVPFLGPVDTYPAEPANPGMLLDATQSVTARVYVRSGVGGPTGVGPLAINLTVLAGETVVASGTVSKVVNSAAFVPFEFALPVQAALVPAGSLSAVVRAEAAVNQYIFGYEGDHASRVTLPVLSTGPLAAAAALATTVPPVEDAPLAFDGSAAGGVPPYSFAWDFAGEGSSTLEDPSFAFPTAGTKTVTLTVTDAASNVATSTLVLRVRQTDFVGAPRVVVAVVDSGINPYHETYRRPGIQLPLDELRNASDAAMPRAIQLTFGSDHATNVAADAADWASIGESELVWFEGTNVLGISIGDISATEKRILDDPAPSALGDQGGHGTATSDTVLDAWPDAVVVMVENSNAAFSNDIPDAFEWAISQPWIDVISGSLGMHANAPDPIWLYQVPALQRAAWASGKLWVESAGNEPSLTPTDGLDGSPWAISVTGSQSDGEAKEISSSYRYVDVASGFTVDAATYDSVDEDASISGTSFSCPTVAGTLAGAIHELRRAAAWNGGIEGGELVPPTDVTNADVRDAMNKTALYPDFGYIAGIHASGDHAVTPVAPWTQVGWGHVDGALVDDIVAVVASDDYTLPAPPAQKGLAKLYMDAVHTERAAYWGAWLAATQAGMDVEGPGAVVASGPLGPVFALTPIETAHPYAPSTDQSWTVSVPGASSLQVHFEQFETEAAFDFVHLEDLDGIVLAVYHGPGTTDQAGFGYTASAGLLDFWTAPVPGDTVVIRFTSDEAVEFHGFRVDEIAALG